MNQIVSSGFLSGLNSRACKVKEILQEKTMQNNTKCYNKYVRQKFERYFRCLCSVCWLVAEKAFEKSA